jgi:FkbM family methyltransferase
MSLRKTLKQIGGNLLYRLKPNKKSAVEKARHHAAFDSLGAGDVAIDCGANLGLITEVLAQKGAEVHAFEPNPDAFAILRERCSGFPLVHLYPQAVLDKPGQMMLYLHLNYDCNPERFSKGSSLVADKKNVSETRGVEVEVIDLAAFIRNLGKPVKILKMDIEGSEYPLLMHLIRSGVMERIETVLVETHAGSIPSLRDQDADLRKLISEKQLEDKIDLNWV